MKRIAFLISMVLLSASFAYCQSWSWAVNIGGTGTDGAERIVKTKDLGYAMAGKFSGSLWVGNDYLYSLGNKDVLVVRYAPNGSLLWVRSGGGLDNDEGLAVASDDSNNVFVTGYYRGIAVFDSCVLQGVDGDEMFVAKYDAQGNLLWARQANGPGNERGKAVACDAQGNVFVTGYYFDTCYFDSLMLVSPGVDNVFLAKYSPAGDLLWVLDGGSPNETWASCIGVNSNGDAWISGSFEGTAVFGTHSITTNGGNDIFLVKASGAGSWLQAEHAGGLEDDFGNGLYVDEWDHIAITGSFFLTASFYPLASITTNGNKDGFAAYYAPTGNCIWARNFGGSSGDKGIDIAVGPDGFIYVTGFIYGTATFGSIVKPSAGGDDIFVSKYSPSGTIYYAELAGGSSNDYGKGIAVASPGAPVVTGDYNGTAPFGLLSITSLGDRDAYSACFYDGSPQIVVQPQAVTCCVGDPVSLSVAASGNAPINYLWFDAAGSILGAVGSTYSFTPADPSWSGYYYCQVSNAQGSMLTHSVYVAVLPFPDPDLGADQYLPIWDSLIIDAGGPYASYLWNNGATTQTIIFYPPSVGIHLFSVTVTNEASCAGSDSIEIEVFDVGMPDLNSLYGIRYFPNPVKDILTLETGTFAGNMLEIIRPDGQAISSRRISAGNTYNIVLTDQAAGIYVVRLIAENGKHVSLRVLKE